MICADIKGPGVSTTFPRRASRKERNSRPGSRIDIRAGDDVDDLVAGIADLDADAIAVVCWEHSVLTDIATALGVDDAPDYPSSEYDWQWTVRRGELVQDNENC